MTMPMTMPMPILSVDFARRYPPRVTAFTQPFWDALGDGRFTITRCAKCARPSFPPKPICPHCWTEQVVWEEIATTGALYSWTRVHAGPAIFEADLPYDVGIVDLDAGLRIATPLVGQSDEWQCGMRVELVTRNFLDGPFFAAMPIRASAV